MSNKNIKRHAITSSLRDSVISVLDLFQVLTL